MPRHSPTGTVTTNEKHEPVATPFPSRCSERLEPGPSLRVWCHAVTQPKSPRVNERINVPQVRLIGADGTNYGIVPTAQARAIAAEAELDLVEVSPDAKPPVCRVADAGKLRYEASIRAKEARRGSSKNTLKELKYRPAIDGHDYETKTNWARKFLKAGHPVKVTVMLRGREQGRPEMADKIFERLVADLAELGTLRGSISRMGRDVIATFEPKKTKP